MGVLPPSRSTAGALALGRRITSGALFVNAVVASDPRLPFGGTKRNGYGRELGEAGALDFTNARTYGIGTGGRAHRSCHGVSPMCVLVLGRPGAGKGTRAQIIAGNPFRSAIQPNNNPPNGLARKPTAKTTNVSSTSETAFPLWKNWEAKNGVNVV